MSHNVVSERRSRWTHTARLEAVFADPLRMRILGECNMREMSPRSFYEEFGYATLAKVEQAFELLVQFEWLEPVQDPNTKPLEPLDRLHRGTGVAVVEDSLWETFPASTRSLMGGRVLETFITRAKEAQKAGTLAIRPDAHLSWVGLELDGEAWDAIADRLNTLFHFVFEEQERAKTRMAESGEEPTPATVALFAFESPLRPVKTR